MSMSVVEKVCWRLRLGSSSGSRESGIWESMAIFFMPDTEIVWDCMCMRFMDVHVKVVIAARERMSTRS